MEPTRRRSRENRSSKRSFRSSTGSIADTSKFDISNAIVEKRLQMVLEEEQQKLIIYSVREELMQRVMDECHKRYMERQCVNFTVHCAYRALVQIVNLGLFHHDAGKPFYTGHPSWLDDKPPEPSPADSWAVNQVAIKRKPIPKPLTPTSTEVVTLANVDVLGELENVFTGIETSKEKNLSEVTVDVGVEVIYKAENIEETGEIESALQLSCPPATEVTLGLEEERLSSSLDQVHPLSIFTQTTEMPKEYLPHSMKSARSKLKGLVTKIAERPVLDIDEISPAKSKLSVSVFSPLRSDAKYKEKLVAKEEDEAPSDIEV